MVNRGEMKKFYASLKPSSSYIDRYSVLEFYKELKTRILAIDEPTIRAVMSFLLLTGARIKEVIPNEKYKTAVLFEHLANVSDRGEIQLPITEKKNGRYKGEARLAILYDIDLYNVVAEYIVKYRIKWDSPVLKKSFFNPIHFKEFLFHVARWNKSMDYYNRREKMMISFYNKFWWCYVPKRVYDEKRGDVRVKANFLKRLIEKKKRIPFKDLLISYIVFPITYWTVYRHISQIKMKAVLVGARTGHMIEGERGLYTHIGREYLVNVWLREHDINEWEIARVLNWSKVENIQYYIRRNAEVVRSVAERIGLKFEGSGEKRYLDRLEKMNEKNYEKAKNEVSSYD